VTKFWDEHAAGTVGVNIIDSNIRVKFTQKTEIVKNRKNLVWLEEVLIFGFSLIDLCFQIPHYRVDEIIQIVSSRRICGVNLAKGGGENLQKKTLNTWLFENNTTLWRNFLRDIAEEGLPARDMVFESTKRLRRMLSRLYTATRIQLRVVGH
jgi:hypothetical protein